MKRFIPYFDDVKEAALRTYALLLLRLGVGIMMLAGHGWGKLTSYVEMSGRFPDPLGIGSMASLSLAIFAEFFCSLALIAGFFTRLAVIPLIINMLVAVFIVHAGDPYARQEFGLIYLLPYLTILLAGPGEISMDAILRRR